MANKAQQELQNLLQMQQQGEAAAANSLKLMNARSDFAARPEGDAKFALPEALATAVGAGWLLGPAGGLLMGVAQGILGKREEQRAIDAWAEELGVLEDTNRVFNDELDRLATSATNDNDVEQLSSLQTQKDAAMRMMSSASPELQQQGADLLADFSQRLNDYTLTQETQRIDAEVRDAEAARLLSKEQNDWYVAAQTRFANRTQPYKNVMKQTDIALQALANGTPSDLWAAIKLVNKALDQSSAVMQGEVEATEAIGGYKAELNNFLEKFRSGAQLQDTERKDLMDLMHTIRSTESKFALATEIEFKNQMDTLEMPVKFYDDFKVVDNVPAGNRSEFKSRTAPTEDIERAASDALFPFSDEGILLNLKHAWSNIFGGKSDKQKAQELEAARRRAPFYGSNQ